MALVRGTTPSIKFTFNTVDVSDIVTAYLVVKQWESVVIEKDLSFATADAEAGTLTWTLSQQDTLELENSKTCRIMCDWLTSTGTRGRSVEHVETVENPGKQVVIH